MFVKIIEDSMSPEDKRLITFQLTYHRFIHSELMTHRVFSRNASSSRAIPVQKMIELVRTNPATPLYWGKNQPGMQAREELTGPALEESKRLWMLAAQQAADIAEQMNEVGLHKQIANRILEPFQYIHVVLTSSEWENFFGLRVHPDAQPEFNHLASMMHREIALSESNCLDYGQWHLPYVTTKERKELSIVDALRVSAARCCRVSYLKHDGSSASLEEDIALCDKLAKSNPIHASPFEHQATPNLLSVLGFNGNFSGWMQHRKFIENPKVVENIVRVFNLKK